jgi:hypothetical protein
MLAAAAAVVLIAGPALAQITLPDPLAVEIPDDGRSSIGADESPLRELLESAGSPLGPVQHDREGAEFPLGPTLVTWTDGVNTRAEYVYVYPFGQTPVGSTAYERATSGNAATNVVRDREGRIHVAWLDSGRDVDRVMYRRGTQDPVTGRISWDISATRISEDSNDTWNSMVGVAVSDGYVHFVWYGGGNNSYYRRLRLSDMTFDPIRSTGASGSLSDNGPDIQVRTDDEIHVVTPANSGTGGRYALSSDGGENWTVEEIPRPASGIRMKAAAVAVDSAGNAHIVFPWLVRDAAPRFWELRYVRRTVGGVWEDGHYVLGQFAEWLDPRSDADPANDDWDMLSDWLDITVDRDDNLHVVWHGTVNTHAFGNDEAFYIRRQATGPGAWSTIWDPYVSLWPTDRGYSFAPSISVDSRSGIAVPVVFYDTSTSYEFDSNFKLMLDGVWDGRPANALTTMAADGYGLSTWFPCAAPELYVHPSGRIWIDVVATDWPAEASSDMIVVHQRSEVTALVLPITELSVEPDRLVWAESYGATEYDLVRGDLGALRSSDGDFTVATQECLAENETGSVVDYSTVPDPGEGFWFLVRGTEATGAMTYDSLFPSQVESRDDEINEVGVCF